MKRTAGQASQYSVFHCTVAISRSVIAVFLVVSGVAAQSPHSSFLSTKGMALIPGSTFEMGIDASEISPLMERFGIKRAGLFEEEVPKHRVAVPSFYIDRTEVTNEQFKRFIEQNPEWRKNNIFPAYHNGKYLQQWQQDNFPAGRENYPVVFVSWYAAAAFCRSQGKRLPTEPEWEYAARGGLDRKSFPWGDEMPDNTRANFSASKHGGATAVATYQANGYGLHDMAGNVWEYLADDWQKYPLKPGHDPTGMFRDGSFLSVKTRRSLRGGSYAGNAINMRVTYRDSHAPENAADHVGFRCAMTAPVQSEAVNELLRLHYQDRAAHFNRDANVIFSQFADEYFSVGSGNVRIPDRVAGQKRMQAYFDASTFLEWDDIAPPVIRVSDDGTMAYVHVHKKVRLTAKDPSGKNKEETEVFAWTTTYRKIAGKWKVTSVTSTNTPGEEK